MAPDKSTMLDDNDFYIGYHPTAPPKTGRYVRRVAVTVLGVVAILGALLAADQQPADSAFFEYGIDRELSGRIVEHPYPTLLVPRPGLTDRAVAYSRYYLVGQGKHGAEEEVRGLDGHQVSLHGSLIYRDGETMLEVARAEVRTPVAPPAGITTAVLGHLTLQGEIVDSKCYLGVMRPGHGGVHRGCATRCLSGGAPPLLIVRDSSGPARFILLTDREGAPLPMSQLLQKIAVPVRVSGELLREDEMLVMRVEGIED